MITIIFFHECNLLNDCIFLANEWAEDETLGEIISFRDYKVEIWLEVFSSVFSKNITTEGFIVLLLPENLALFSFLKEVKPSPGGKIVKPLTFDILFLPPRHSR